MTTELIFGMMGGLGLFLYGMQLLSDGLQKATGDTNLWHDGGSGVIFIRNAVAQ